MHRSQNRVFTNIRFFSVSRIVSGLAVFIFFSSSLLAYMPGRYSPLDQFVLRNSKERPTSLSVVINGQQVQVARFYYNNSGRLTREVYAGKDGITQGQTKYNYKDGKLIGESLYNKKEELVENRVFSYDRHGLIAMRVFNKDKQLIINQFINSEKNRIISGRQVNGKQTDRFFIRYEKNRPVLMKVLREDGKLISKVTFTYSKSGALKERIRDQNDSLSRCVYKYQAGGKLESYSYYTKVEGKWVLTKTLVLNY